MSEESEARRREMEQERQAQVLARAVVKEFTRAEQHRVEQQAARERWPELSPDERRQHEQEAAQAEYNWGQKCLAEMEQARQSHGGSLESVKVAFKLTTYRVFLCGALILTVVSYVDIYRWIHSDQGEFPDLPMWAAPLICLCLYVSRRIEWRLIAVYKDFDQHFSNWKVLAVLLLSGPAVALSGLFLFASIIDHLVF